MAFTACSESDRFDSRALSRLAEGEQLVDASTADAASSDARPVGAEAPDEAPAETPLDIMKARFGWAPAVALARCVEAIGSLREDRSLGAVVTTVTLEVTEVLLGELQERRVQVIVDGGVAGEHRSHAPHAGEYEAGKTYLLMLSRNRNGRPVLLGDSASSGLVDLERSVVRYLDTDYPIREIDSVLEIVSKDSLIDYRAAGSSGVAQ